MSLKKYRVDLEMVPAKRFIGEPEEMKATVGSFYLVMHYLWQEWGIDPTQFPEKLRTRTLQKIRLLLSRNYSVITVSEKLLEWFWSEGMERWRN